LKRSLYWGWLWKMFQSRYCHITV